MNSSPPAAPDADTLVAGILAALELRQPGAAQHAERVAETALNLTAVLDPALAARSGIGHPYLLHDIGKLGVPDAVILKAGRLTPSELRIMQTHTKHGEEMVRRLRFLSPLVRDVVACHHERWDGRGYPHGLGAWAIPLAARILAVVDARAKALLWKAVRSDSCSDVPSVPGNRDLLPHANARPSPGACSA